MIMTFTQVLESEFYYLVESIEHGSSDSTNTQNSIRELFEKTGYTYSL